MMLKMLCLKEIFAFVHVPEKTVKKIFGKRPANNTEKKNKD